MRDPAGRKPYRKDETVTHRAAVVRHTDHAHQQAESDRRAAGDNFGWQAVVDRVLDPARRPKAPTTAELDART